MPSPANVSDQFRVLSIAGGGFRGLFAVEILRRLEARFGYPLASHFDLVAGTSVGGLLAIAVARRIPMDRLSNIFEERGREIFRPPTRQVLRWFAGLRGFWRSQFNPDGLAALIDELAGARTILSDTCVPILVPAYSLSTSKPFEFRTSDPSQSQTLLRDIGLATSAAPTYFPIHAIDGRHFADGAMHANTPDVLAISEAMVMYGAQLQNISMVSVGTTFAYRTSPNPPRRDIGKISWLARLNIVDRLIDAQDHNTVFLADRFLGRRYLRLNRLLTPSVATRVHLARADDLAVRILRDAAARTWQSLEANRPKMSRLDLSLRR